MEPTYAPKKRSAPIISAQARKELIAKYGQQAVSVIAARISYYRSNAITKKRRSAQITFSLTFDQCRELLESPCVFCGDRPICRIYKYEHRVSGIDRVNPKFGYEPWNVIPCCPRCNWAKANMSISEFTEWLSGVVDHQVLLRSGKGYDEYQSTWWYENLIAAADCS